MDSANFTATFVRVPAFADVPYPVQIAVFLVLSVALLLGLRKITLKWLTKNNVKTNTDSFIGKTFELIDPITKHANGSIKINGVVWSATSEDGSLIDSGTEVVVTSIRGNTVIVTKSSQNESIKKENK